MSTEFERTEFISGDSPEDYERLTIPGGVAVSDEGVIDMEVIYDGDTVIVRGDDGDLMHMGTLCYLDYIVNKFIRDLIEEDGETTRHPKGITPGHIVCHVVQALHEQMHMVEVEKKLAALSQIMGEDARGNPLAALAALGLSPVGAFMVGPDGEVAQVMSPGDIENRLGGGGGIVLEGEAETLEDDGIFVQGLRIESVEIVEDGSDDEGNGGVEES